MKPNILFVMTDQHRLSAVGAYGPTPCRTPNLDRLAREGIRFQNAYTATPVCSPARATVMTGLYAHTHGITSNIHEIGCSVHELQDRLELLPRKLQAQGYSAGYAGKWHLGTDRETSFLAANRPSTPTSVGFEGPGLLADGAGGGHAAQYVAWLKKNRFPPHALKPWTEKTRCIRSRELDLPVEATVEAFLVDTTIGLIKDFAAREKPFFMSVNFWGPHTPYWTTREFLDLYRGVPIPPWENYGWDSRGIPGPHHYKIHWDKENLAWDDWAMAIRYYYARVSLIDSQIGRLLEHLRGAGVLESTVVIFTADHGETLGSHGGLLDKGWHHFEEIHRIPLIVRMPGGDGAGRVVDAFVSSADYYPTILDLAGTAGEAHGRSILPLIRGEENRLRDAVVSEFLGLGNVATCMKTIRAGNLKYGYNLTFRDELYDLERDPHETQNRIDDPDYRKAVGDLRERLDQWMIETGDPALRMVRWHRRRSADAPGT